MNAGMVRDILLALQEILILNDYQLVNKQTLDNSNNIQIDFDKKLLEYTLRRKINDFRKSI